MSEKISNLDNLTLSFDKVIRQYDQYGGNTVGPILTTNSFKIFKALVTSGLFDLSSDDQYLKHCLWDVMSSDNFRGSSHNVKNSLAVIKLLVENGLDVNYRLLIEDMTLLMVAGYFKSYELFAYLIEQGADSSLLSYHNRNAASYTIQTLGLNDPTYNKESATKIVNLLINKNDTVVNHGNWISSSHYVYPELQSKFKTVISTK